MGSGFCCWDHEWNDLPYDVVGNIAERLALVDYIQFGRVCMAWKSALSGGICLPKSPQTPWLIAENRKREDDTSIEFLDLFSETQRVYKTKFPRHTAGHKLFSNGGPWLVTISPNLEDTTIVWNPVANDEVYHFPSILNLPVDCRRICTRRKGTTNLGRYEGFDIAHEHFVAMIKPFKFKFESDTDILMATIAVYHRGKIAFARAGDVSWTPVCDIFPAVVEDAIFHQGSIYAVVTEGIVKRWDVIIRSNFDPVLLPSKDVALKTCYEPHTFRKCFTTNDTKLAMVWFSGMHSDSIKLKFDQDSRNNKKAWKAVTGLDGACILMDSVAYLPSLGVGLCPSSPPDFF